MTGLVLAGGGAKGAFHLGVVKAFLEKGYNFDGFVGTSMGAVNAAILAQGDFEKAMDLWLNVSMETLFDADEKILIELGKLKLNTDLFLNIKKSLKKIIQTQGIDTTKMKIFISQWLDEDKLRASGKDFGLVTVSLTERKPYELYIEDIPKGQLKNYIMASSCFPGFKSEMIDENSFIDGALYDNSPVNMLIRKGYSEIIEVRTAHTGMYRKLEPHNAHIKTIIPSEYLGSPLIFSLERIQFNINMGYYDAMRSLENLRGVKYYIRHSETINFERILISLRDSIIIEIGKNIGITSIPAKRILFEHIIPKLGAYLKLGKFFDYEDFIISLLENLAIKKEIENYQIYDFEQFVSLINAENFHLYYRKGIKSLIPLTINKNNICIDILTKEILSII